ncbi:MAG TPA: DUF6241 domain-containing protein [Bacillales bacterium]|nr:DUF6241 domain-containing protein [Bacillales bacterium]
MKKGIIWTGIIVVLFAAVGVVAFYGTQSYLKNKNDTVGETDGGSTVVASASAGETDKPADNGSDGKWIKNGLINKEADWTETKIMRTLHEMTHQKIESIQKWGAVPMTLENVKAMIAIVKQRKNKLDHYDKYMNMLKMWKQGDFSKAALQHNELWRLEGGTVGKAVGLLSEPEEAIYIRQHFSDVKGTFHW